MSEALDVLQSIELLLRRVLIAIAGTDKAIASDDELDSKWGDPKVRANPKNLPPSVSDCKGLPMSACPVEFLLPYAEMLEFFADRNEQANVLDDKGRPKADFDRADAAKARGWARRARRGQTSPAIRPAQPASEPPFEFSAPFAPIKDDDIPF